MSFKRIHITPDDHLIDMDEYIDRRDPRPRAKLYIEAERNGLNEVCDAIYYAGNGNFAHEHIDGFETFLVDNGAIEVIQLSRKATARKGDIVHIPPFQPHAIHILEDESIWRAFHQGLWLFDFMRKAIDFRDRNWDLYFSPEFKANNPIKDNAVRVDYGVPECKDVSPNEIPSIRTYDSALAEYTYDGIKLQLKVGRWETGGLKEVWYLHLSKGYKLSWDLIHPFTHLYDVISGSVRVSLQSMEPFTAKTRDLLHIPEFLGGSIETLEDTVLMDAGCQGYLTRFMDELNVYKVKEPSKLKDKAFIKELMKKNNYHVLFESL